MPETKSEKAISSTEPLQLDAFSLRLKLVLAFAVLSLLPFIFIAVRITGMWKYIAGLSAQGNFADSELARAVTEQSNAFIVGSIEFSVVFFILVCAGIIFADRILVGPLYKIIDWMRTARENKFAALAPLPVQSGDEWSALGYEIDQSIKYFQEVESRERQIAEEKGEFISVAAHQLRTPLTGLKWTLEVLRDSSTTPESKAKLLDQVSGTTERMVRLVDDVLDVAKIEEGKFGYEYAITDIIGPMQHLINDFLVVGKSRDVALVFEHGEVALPVYMDVNRVTLAVSNLISNSLDYTRAGGRITLRIERAGRQVRISVQDTGIGISPEDKRRLFTKFYRGESARRMHPDGSGLGLFIARNVALRHGGDVTVESEAGKGSTLSFNVPLEKADMGKVEVSVGNFFASF
ncbi:HAMP domain-containing histidine kinase [Candidatus Kaiserbacteria bacterium]|nr:HAMP domain-containing histidine kinase [Candidatus Kaiserbacteria bacterium]